MKIVMLLALLIPVLDADVTRSYALEPEVLSGLRGWGEDEWTGREIKNVPFESPLFQGGDELRDWSLEAAKILKLEKFEGQLIWNERLGRFVMRAEAALHEEFQEKMEERFVEKIPELTVSVYTYAERPEWSWKTIWEMMPKGGELVGEISWLASEGEGNRAAAPQRKLVVEADLGASAERLEGEFKVMSKIEGAVFSFEGKVDTAVGVPWVMEIGSLDGRRTLFMVVECEWVRRDGTGYDEWILTEEGKSPLREARLRNAEGYEIEFLRVENGVRVYRVPGGSLDWLRQPLTNLPKDENGEENPFFDGGKPAGIRPSPKYEGDDPVFEGVDRNDLVDLSEKMGLNGVKIGKGQFVVLRTSTSRLYVRLEQDALELLMGCLIVPGGDPPRPILLEFDLVESEEKLSMVQIREGEGKMIRRVVAQVMMGSSGRVTLGRDLLLEAEALQDGAEGVIQFSGLLSEVRKKRKKASFQTAMILESGIPVAVHESRLGEVWRTWIVKGMVVELSKESEDAK